MDHFIKKMHVCTNNMKIIEKKYFYRRASLEMYEVYLIQINSDTHFTHY